MSQYVETACKTFTAGGAIAVFLRVKLSAGVLAAAGVNEDEIGTIERATFASGDKVAVRLLSAQGTRKMVASAAISAGARIYQAAGGKISATPAGKCLGLALEAASDEDDVIEVLYDPHLFASIEGVAGGYKIARGQHTTVAASDTVVTGLATVVSAVAVLDDDPVDGVMQVTASIGDQAGAPAAGSILIKGWKSTDGDATQIAATTFAKKVNWIAIGT